jgi:hypothetical protein
MVKYVYGGRVYGVQLNHETTDIELKVKVTRNRLDIGPTNVPIPDWVLRELPRLEQLQKELKEKIVAQKGESK